MLIMRRAKLWKEWRGRRDSNPAISCVVGSLSKKLDDDVIEMSYESRRTAMNWEEKVNSKGEVTRCFRQEKAP